VHASQASALAGKMTHCIELVVVVVVVHKQSGGSALHGQYVSPRLQASHPSCVAGSSTHWPVGLGISVVAVAPSFFMLCILPGLGVVVDSPVGSP